MKDNIKSWRRDTNTYLLVDPLHRLSSYSSTPTHKNNLNFDDHTHILPLHRFIHSLNLFVGKRKERDEKKSLSVSDSCSFFFFYSPSNTITDLYLYSLRNRTNTDVGSTIWRTQKLLDIYIYICCVSSYVIPSLL